MKCPKCGTASRQYQTRESDGTVRRLRECNSTSCKHRFATVERVESSGCEAESEMLELLKLAARVLDDEDMDVDVDESIAKINSFLKKHSKRAARTSKSKEDDARRKVLDLRKRYVDLDTESIAERVGVSVDYVRDVLRQHNAKTA